MQIMYGIMGERRLIEWEVDWLPGYLESKPVRIGNAASLQFQLDVYGELMDTFEQARKGGLAPRRERLGRAGRAGQACRRILVPSPTTASGRRAARRSTSSIPR